MGDITHPLVATPFAAGDVLDPERVAEGVYVPQSTPNNMAVMNGLIEKANLVGGYSITHDMVRPGAMATAVSRGQTANVDVFADFFIGDYLATNFSDTIARGQTFVGLRFYVPYDCTLVMLSWHVGVIVDGGHRWKEGATSTANVYVAEDEENHTVAANSHIPASAGSASQDSTLLVLHIDGVEQKPLSRRIKTGRASMLGKDYVATASSTVKPMIGSGPDNWTTEEFNEPCKPDHRWWSGHFNIDSGDALTKGWHTASIRVTNGKWTSVGPPATHKVAPHVRFKTCHMTAIPIR